MVSDGQGKFVLKDLDPQLLFRLLVVADGHVPTYSPQQVDPTSRGDVKLALKPHNLDRRDPALIVRGRVIDENGNAVAGAVVTPFGLMFANGGSSFGGLVGVDALAVTDQRGEFRIGVSDKKAALFVRVSASFLAPCKPIAIPPGPKGTEIKLAAGVTVTGTVVKDGKKLAAVGVGLVQQFRGADTSTSSFVIATDEKGRFQFNNVPADEAYFIYGLMDSCRQFGAIPVKPIKVGAAGTSQEAGTLTLEAGFRLSGRVILSDGKPLPAQTRIIIIRRKAWDSQIVTASKDGSFTFSGLPAEQYSLSLIRVPGYHISPKNTSYDLVNGRLIGTVNRDISGVAFLLEPGPALRLNYSQEISRENTRRQQSPFGGIANSPKKP